MIEGLFNAAFLLIAIGIIWLIVLSDEKRTPLYFIGGGLFMLWFVLATKFFERAPL